MKKLVSLTLALLIIFGTAASVMAMDSALFTWTPESTEYAEIRRDSNVIARIVVGSDIHIGDINATPKLENAYKAIGKLGGADALILAGDLTDNGRVAQLEELQRIISENSKELTIDIDGFTGTGAGSSAPVDTTIAMMGNHEYFDSDVDTAQDRFKTILGQDLDKLYWIEGKIPLIKISMTSGSYFENYKDKHEFLENALKEVEESGWDGHIFVISHMGVSGTMVGAPGADDNPYLDKTVELMAKYPQIIHVSGHSHQVSMNPAFIDQSAGFTCMTDGVLGEDYNEEEEFGSAAIIFDVKDNGTTEFHRVDFQNAKLLFDDEEWVLDASDKPEDFIYYSSQSKAKASAHPENTYTLKSKAPTFPDDAWIKVTDLGNHDAIQVTFSSTAVPASDYNYDYIRRYRVRAIPVGNDSSETITVYGQNDAYKPAEDRVSEMTVTLVGLDWNTDYKVEVRAMTGLGVASSPITAADTVNIGIMEFSPVKPIYDLDFSSGDFQDAVGHKASLFPVIKAVDDETLGKKAAYFKGIGQNKYSFNAEELEEIRYEYTIEALIKMPDVENKQEFFSLMDCASVSLGVENGSVYAFSVVTTSANSNNNYAVRAPITANEWTHIAVTYDSKYVNIYANGELVDSAKHTGGLNETYDENTDTDNLFMYVGARHDKDGNFSVKSGTMMNQIKLYSGTKSAEEIKAAYEAAMTPSAPSFDPDSVTLPFTDVKSGSWFESAVKYAYSKGLMNGMSDTKFAPNGTMNRAMVVTVLWRMENSPAPAAKAPFTDLKQNWYKDAVAWAYENAIVTGTGATTFDPNGSITREQLAAILYRYSEYKKYDITKSESLDSFPDVKKVHSWAKDAMAWSYAEELITGKNEGGAVLLDPRGNATRAQVATILQRFCEKFN